MSEELLRDLKMGHDDLNQRVTKIEAEMPSLAALKLQMEACDLMSKEMQERSKRSDDATNNNTKASLEQTKAITNLTVVVHALVEKVEKDHDPIIIKSRSMLNWWDKFCIWFSFNQRIAKWTIGSVLTMAALAAALKQLGVW